VVAALPVSTLNPLTYLHKPPLSFVGFKDNLNPCDSTPDKLTPMSFSTNRLFRIFDALKGFKIIINEQGILIIYMGLKAKD
jgi:hypothetical protein